MPAPPVDDGPRVRFQILGPLEVVAHGRPVAIPAGKQSVLLAMLLLRADQTVTVQELGDKLWDGRAPADPRGTVQKYVMRLRRALAPTGCLIHTEPEGYRLELQPGMLDVDRFAELVEEGVRLADAGELQVASARLAAALALWRAVPPLANVVSGALHRDETPRLVERYLQAAELRIDLDLQLGRHAEVCGELLDLTGAHPLRERFWVQRMRALYGANRQGEALEAYRAVTRLLAEELGIDPGPELRATHQQILSGVAHPEAATPAPWTTVLPPRQLPVEARGVVGRETAIGEIVDVLRVVPDAGARLVLVTGREGVGTTTVAVAAAHRLVADFPDGQLFVELAGVDGAPELDEVLAHVLRGLGVPEEALPARRADAVAVYRSLTAGRRLLVVLDGAGSAAVVRALLPGSNTCAVLVTSAHELPDLLVAPGGHRCALDVLTPGQARDVLRGVIGEDRVRAEEQAVARLVARCGGLPLALRVAAAHLATRPGLTIGAHLEELGRTERVEPAPPRIAAGGGRPTAVWWRTGRVVPPVERQRGPDPGEVPGAMGCTGVGVVRAPMAGW